MKAFPSIFLKNKGNVNGVKRVFEKEEFACLITYSADRKSSQFCVQAICSAMTDGMPSVTALMPHISALTGTA
ncbi:MAG: hypothetical protein B6245_20870 [Desulfobacteraceae bacterium 4572_88]|nr:MAG: hypothetical protein B6245_20870 [Desulfobacteraceae bacterium 4572_88]